jgi:hypothetical protein
MDSSNMIQTPKKNRIAPGGLLISQHNFKPKPIHPYSYTAQVDPGFHFIKRKQFFPVNKISRLSGGTETMVADPLHFFADLDPASHLNADPVPTFHFNADPDHSPHQSDENQWSIGHQGDPGPVFDSKADPDPPSKNNADSCGSGSAILTEKITFEGYTGP